MQYLKIPLERIPVLIGEKGSVKRQIEKDTCTKIGIADTSVTVESTEGNSMNELVASNMVLAIGRGFNPDIAIMLRNDEYTLEVIHLSDYANTPKAFDRIKSRVIGVSGKARKNIEDISSAHISVYGKTIAILGSFDDIALAKQAVLMLIEGARHATVYRFLERTKAAERETPWSGKYPENLKP